MTLPHEVPAHRIDSYRDRTAKYCCAVFVINEGERLLAQLDRMAPNTLGVDVVVADGGSTDGSTERGLLTARGVRALLVKTGPGKLSAQMRMAIDFTLSEGYAGLIAIDGNNKDDPAAIPTFAAALDAGFDHVQGSRFVPGGRAVNTPLPRMLGIKLVHAPLISLSAGYRYTDTTNGFRGYSRRLLTDPRVQPLRDVFTAYELHYYLAIRAARLGMRITELPVTREYPASGPTPTKISPLRGNLKVLKTLIAACLHRYDP